MSLELPFEIKIVNPKPVDYYYLDDGSPYADVSAVNTAIPQEVRYEGMTVNVANVEYWYKDGVTDLDLVEKIVIATGDLTYEHTQGVASSSWTITHNLGKRPSVTIVDSLDNEVVGDVQYTNLNELTVSFSASFSGKAYLN